LAVERKFDGRCGVGIFFVDGLNQCFPLFDELSDLIHVVIGSLDASNDGWTHFQILGEPSLGIEGVAVIENERFAMDIRQWFVLRVLVVLAALIDRAGSSVTHGTGEAMDAVHSRVGALRATCGSSITRSALRRHGGRNCVGLVGVELC
jgi:hypothetical protein